MKLIPQKIIFLKFFFQKREPEILILFTHIIEKVNVLLGNELPKIL